MSDQVTYTVLQKLCNSELFLLLLLMVLNNILAELLHKLSTPATYIHFHD